MREYNFYIDDSGTRDPDRKPDLNAAGDWFALGGVIIAREAENEARRLHAEFCGRWGITYPLHSVKIRHRSAPFEWIGALATDDKTRFYNDLDLLVRNLPVHALACVIDRPGYNRRYLEQYGAQRWSLCKTAFPILAERAAKFAEMNDARVRLFVERSDKKAEAAVRGYYDKLREEGMPFTGSGKDKYAPLSATSLKNRLYELAFKKKSSPMLQIADLLLYPLCKFAYYSDYRPMETLRQEGKLLEAILPIEAHPTIGTKYSCFPAKEPDQNK